MHWGCNLAIFFFLFFFSDSVFFYVKKCERMDKSVFSVNQNQPNGNISVAPSYVFCQEFDFTLNDG